MMKKTLVRGMMVLGVAAMVGILATGCSTSGTAGAGLSSLLSTWPATEPVKTGSPTVDTTAASVADLYATCKQLFGAQDAVLTSNPAYKEFTAYCADNKLTGDAAAAYLKTLSAEKQAQIATGKMSVTQAGFNLDTLTQLLAKANELAPTVAALAKDPMSLITAKGLAAVTQTGAVTSSLKNMQSQLTATTTNLPAMINTAAALLAVK